MVKELVFWRDNPPPILRTQGVPLPALGSTVGLDPAGWDGRMPPLEDGPISAFLELRSVPELHDRVIGSR